ncbi:hypothetical protein [Brevibacillus sp. H7]|uniref:hypothetical protein n=1 Tax=Brevibacillus sp. H7 TaxID=3349138 RepID=UPI0037FDF838
MSAALFNEWTALPWRRLIIGGFFKIALFFYAAVKGVADLLQVKKNAGIPLVLLIVAWVRARDIDFFQREKYRK